MKLVAFFGVIAVFVYGGYKIQQNDDRKAVADFAIRSKVEVLVETTAKLQKSVETYQKKKQNEGETLPSGKVISLAELEDSGVLRKEDLDQQIEIEKFSYLVLPENAPDQSLKMILVTNKGRATVNKKGQGALYEK